MYQKTDPTLYPRWPFLLKIYFFNHQNFCFPMSYSLVDPSQKSFVSIRISRWPPPQNSFDIGTYGKMQNNAQIQEGGPFFCEEKGVVIEVGMRYRTLFSYGNMNK
jgi:hypothetical protein